MSVLCGSMMIAGRQPFSPYGASVTLNSSDKAANAVVFGGNLGVYSNSSSTDWADIRATAGKLAGCWYWEVTLTQATNSYTYCACGIGDASFTLTSGVGLTNKSVGFQGNNSASSAQVSGYTNSESSSIGGWQLNGIVMFALDMNRGELYVGLNGVWGNNSVPSIRKNPTITGITGTAFPAIGIEGADGGTINGDRCTINFGGSAFTYPFPN